MHFFNSKWALRNEKGIDQGQTRQNYARAFRKAILDFSSLQNNSNLIAVESSPRYMLSSDRIPDMIMCVTPWVKLLATVRDPIGRVSSHYRFLDEGRRKDGKPMVDWETWVNDDIQLLTIAGVLNATTPEEENKAWKMYHRRPTWIVCDSNRTLLVCYGSCRQTTFGFVCFTKRSLSSQPTKRVQ